MKQRGESDFLKVLKKFFVIKPWSEKSGHTGYTPPKKPPTPSEFVVVENPDEFNRDNPGMHVVVVTPESDEDEPISVKDLVIKAKKHNKKIIFLTERREPIHSEPIEEDEGALFFAHGRNGRKKRTRTGKKHTHKKRRKSKIIRRSQIKKSKSKKSQKKRVTRKQRRKRRNGGSGNGTQAQSTGTPLPSIPETQEAAPVHSPPRAFAELALMLARTLHEDPTPQQIEQVRATLVQRLAPTTPSS